MPATPTREFLSGFDRGRMWQQNNIYVRKHYTPKALTVSYIGAVICNVDLKRIEKKFVGLGFKKKKKSKYKGVVRSQLVFLTSVHCLLQLHCVCTSVLKRKTYHTCQRRPASKALSRERCSILCKKENTFSKLFTSFNFAAGVCRRGSDCVVITSMLVHRGSGRRKLQQSDYISSVTSQQILYLCPCG